MQATVKKICAWFSGRYVHALEFLILKGVRVEQYIFENLGCLGCLRCLSLFELPCGENKSFIRTENFNTAHLVLMNSCHVCLDSGWHFLNSAENRKPLMHSSDYR